MTKFRLLLLVTILVLSLGIVGCDGLGSLGSGGDNKNPKKDEKVTFKIYRPDADLEWLVAEDKTVEVKKDDDIHKVVLENLVSGEPASKDVLNIFPKGTKVLDVKIDDGLVTANFSKEILKDEIGGSSYEMMLVYSIVNTLSEIPDVMDVQLLVEGEKVETFTGHMDTLDPLKKNEDVIKK